MSDDEAKPDKRVIVCNYVDGTSPVSSGARAYVQEVPGDPERCFLLVRSRGGRHIEKWEQTKRLATFRIVTVPPTHPLYERLWATQGEAELNMQIMRLQWTVTGVKPEGWDALCYTEHN